MPDFVLILSYGAVQHKLTNYRNAKIFSAATGGFI